MKDYFIYSNKGIVNRDIVKVWNHNETSSDLSNSCYVPVNCCIVVPNLFESLKDLRNAIAVN